MVFPCISADRVRAGGFSAACRHATAIDTSGGEPNKPSLLAFPRILTRIGK
jgi:hypothetical protein